MQRSSPSAAPTARGAWALALLMAGLLPAQAQDSGQLLRETRPPPAPALPPATPPRVLEAPVRPAISMPEGVAVTVSGFRVSGARAYPLSELQALLAPWVGKRLDIRGLNEAAGALTRFYQGQGHLLSYAYLPAQRVADGVIEIAVLEGKLEAVQIVTAQEVRVRDEVVQAYTDKLVTGADGAPVLQGAVERQLLLINDIPGVTARAAFTPGANTGGAEMVVSVAEDEPFELRGEINNHGGKSTGRIRLGLAMQLRDVFGWGDHTQARGFVSEKGGLVTGTLISSVPLGGDGWRMGASASRLRYALGGNFANLFAEGTANTVGVDASYALRRSTDGNLTGRVALERKKLRDDINAFGDSNIRSTHLAEAGLNFDFRDPLGGLGAGSLSGIKGRQSGPAGERSGWFKLFGQLARDQPLFGGVSLYTRITGQTTDMSLDSSEKLGLAGAGAVRAYAAGEASVDHGVIGSIELRYAYDFVGGNLVTSLFHDYGGGMRNRKGLGTPGNDAELNGTGLGLAWTQGPLAFNATLAWRGKQLPTTDTADPRPRLFLQMFYTP